MQELIRLLHKFGYQDQCVSILGFCMAALLNQQLSELRENLPFLHLCGRDDYHAEEALRDVICPLSDQTKKDRCSASGSNEQGLLILASLSNVQPLLIDNGFGYGEGCNNIKKLLVGSYARILPRPIVLIEDESNWDNELSSCGFYVDYDERVWETEFTDAIEALWKMDSQLASMNTKLLHYALSREPEDVRSALDEARKYAPKMWPGRAARNFAVILGGYLMFCDCLGIKCDISAVAKSLVGPSEGTIEYTY